jgi:transposase
VVYRSDAASDGFWFRRWLARSDIRNSVVDSATIATKRRKRRAKSVRLDAATLISMLIRWHNGEKRLTLRRLG